MRPSIRWTVLAVLSLSSCSLEAVPGTYGLDGLTDDIDGGLFVDGSFLRPDGGPLPDGGSNQRPDGAVESCSGVASGQSEHRLRFAAAQVISASECASETQTRTCTAGSWSNWSGSFQAESCQEAPHASCGVVLHGNNDVRRRYAAALVKDAGKCKFEEQYSLCSDGELGPWSGSYTALECKVDFLGSCDLLASQYECVTGSTCVISAARLDTVCLGTTGHDCSNNNECASGTCILGKCGAQSGPTGSCDDASDCTGCTGRFGISTSASCVQNQCRCSEGSTCGSASLGNDHNDWCLGTCVANVCSTPNMACDALNGDLDCRDQYVCNVTPTNTRRCSYPSGHTCDSNTQCAAACRPLADNLAAATCQPLGTSGEPCHGTDNSDCAAPLVCRANSTCQPKGTLTNPCEEDTDCGTFSAAGVNIKLACGLLLNTTGPKLCLIASGQPCSANQDCASGECIESGMGKDKVFVCK